MFVDGAAVVGIVSQDQPVLHPHLHLSELHVFFVSHISNNETEILVVVVIRIVEVEGVAGGVFVLQRLVVFDVCDASPCVGRLLFRIDIPASRLLACTIITVIGRSQYIMLRDDEFVGLEFHIGTFIEMLKIIPTV